MTEERDATIKSLGNIYGMMISLRFDGYGSLKPDMNGNMAILGPLVEPIPSLHRHHPLAETGPWPASQPLALHISLTIRELQWLESTPGHQLFDEWRSQMHPTEDCSKTLVAFLELAQTLVQIVSSLHLLFPLPEPACRPALVYPDFHYSNILVSHEDPTHVTGVVDWEFTSIVPLWAAYTVPASIDDWGDKYELDLERRAEKARLRTVFAEGVVQACPDAAIVAQPADEETEQNIFGRRLLVKMATSGVALYKSFDEVKTMLVKIRECVRAGDGMVAGKLDHLVTLLSRSDP
jgi:hypothetical protein